MRMYYMKYAASLIKTNCSFVQVYKDGTGGWAVVLCGTDDHEGEEGERNAPSLVNMSSSFVQRLIRACV